MPLEKLSACLTTTRTACGVEDVTSDANVITEETWLVESTTLESGVVPVTVTSDTGAPS